MRKKTRAAPLSFPTPFPPRACVRVCVFLFVRVTTTNIDDESDTRPGRPPHGVRSQSRRAGVFSAAPFLPASCGPGRVRSAPVFHAGALGCQERNNEAFV